MNVTFEGLRKCLREPIPEIFDAARYLDAAVAAHAAGKRALADELIRVADNPEITKWTESLWGPGGPHGKKKTSAPLSKDCRSEDRMPATSGKVELRKRDGFRCRFCDIPLIRSEIRSMIRSHYNDSLRWGSCNSDQHSAFQAMALSYDHLIPHARGGSSELNNMIITCAPCNCGRGDLLLEEVGLIDPRSRSPFISTWDGLERFKIYRRLR